MHRIYPAQPAYQTGHIKTADLAFDLYYEMYGNPSGLPVICLHGGPGAGLSPLMHRFFDLSVFHVMAFDQRGAGRSRPSGALEANTTELLLEDIQQLADELGFKRFILFGGSWGATLSVLYAARHPDQVLGLVLRGAFLATESELHWLYGGGAGVLYPTAWRDFLAPLRDLSDDSLTSILSGYDQLLHSDDSFTKNRAARAWNLWEYRVAICDETVGGKTEGGLSESLAMAQIEHHYIHHRCFLEADAVVRQAADLEGVPGILVHGACDHVCQVSNADRLKAAWPRLQLVTPSAGGHSAFTPGMAEALCAANRQMAALYGY